MTKNLPCREMVNFTELEGKTIKALAKEYNASKSWVIRQITIGKLSALKIVEA